MVTKTIMKYRIKALFRQEQIVTSLTILLMSLVMGLVALDVALFAPRSILHVDPVSFSQNLVLLNYLASLCFFSLLVSDLLELLALNSAFMLQIQRYFHSLQRRKEEVHG